MSRTTVRVLLSAAFVISMIPVAWSATTAQTPPGSVGPVDVEKLGPQVGNRVPDFNLPDQRGNRRTLSSIMGPKGALLVFFRSADW